MGVLVSLNALRICHLIVGSIKPNIRRANAETVQGKVYAKAETVPFSTFWPAVSFTNCYLAPHRGILRQFPNELLTRIFHPPIQSGWFVESYKIASVEIFFAPRPFPQSSATCTPGFSRVNLNPASVAPKSPSLKDSP
jgi:hypothetical protein